MEGWMHKIIVIGALASLLVFGVFTYPAEAG